VIYLSGEGVVHSLSERIVREITTALSIPKCTSSAAA
jgi:hypothetical protein